MAKMLIFDDPKLCGHHDWQRCIHPKLNPCVSRPFCTKTIPIFCPLPDAEEKNTTEDLCPMGGEHKWIPSTDGDGKLCEKCRTYRARDAKVDVSDDMCSCGSDEFTRSVCDYCGGYEPR